MTVPKHLLLCSLLLTVPLETSHATETSVPLRQDEIGHYRVSLTVNGAGPFEFVLDTGATQTVITPALVEALALEPSGRPVTVHGVSGPVEVTFYQLNSLEVGGISVPAKRFLGMPVSNFGGDVSYGVLGADFLQAYRLTFDVEGGQLILSDEPNQRPQSRTAIPLINVAHGLMGFEAKVDGKPVTALLDTGARYTILNGAAAEGLPAAPESEGEITVRGASGDPEPATPVVVETIETPGFSWQDKTIGKADLPVFQLLNLDNRPSMIFGADLLRGLRFIVDFKAKTLTIEN